jgi:cytochrome c biogenesis protein CcmG/thiol:disulfide interchange protein DsbE
MRFRFALPLLAFALAFSIAARAQQQIPDITLRNLDGEEVPLKSFLGKGPVQFSFWALWCEPCKQELKVMSKVYERLADSGYVLVGICEDNQKSVAKVKSYASAKEWKFPILLDPDGEALRLLNGQTIPFAVISDHKGNISSTHIGYLAGDEIGLEKEVHELITKSHAK